MKPTKQIKKHNFDGFDYEVELSKHLDYFKRIQIRQRNRPWMVVSPRVAEVLNNLEDEHRG